MPRIIFTAIALLSLQSAHAAEPQKSMVAMGFGTTTCAVFANIYKDNPERTEINFFAWAQGYMSGWNRAQMKQGQPTINLALLQTQTQRDLLLHYCNQHPLAHYVEAVDQLMVDLERKGSGR
jgi:hypothetical protein